MEDNIKITGDEPLIDGMRISVRLRRDFLVTDAAAVLSAGRRAFVDLHPGVSAEIAEQHVTCAAEAVFALFDRDGLKSDYAEIGLATRGSREQLTCNDPRPLSYPPNCFEGDLDVFAISPSDPTTTN